MLAGCAGLYTKIPVLDVKEKGPLPQAWERFGAYYIADDLIISANNTENSGSGVTEFTVFKKIRILNTQGTIWGTVPVWRYTDRLAFFACTLSDAGGNRIPLQTSELRAKYEQSGKVVIPKVTPGSTLTIRMVFTQEHAPAIYEHWFSRPIPVRTGRLVIHADNDMKFTYDNKVYGTRVRPGTCSAGSYEGFTACWNVNNLEPMDSTPYSPRLSESLPRVALRINPLYGTHGNTITKWSEMAGVIDQLVATPALENADDEIAQKAAEITRGKKNAKTRAVAIVEWVQQNVLCGLDPVKSKVTDILHGARSDMLAVSILCRELLKAAGIKADLILTRAHSRGGFDPDFLSFTGCREGLLSVSFDSTAYCICPVFTGYPIGAYPADYFDLSGLNMDSYKTVKLPAPRWDRFDERCHMTLSLASDTALQTMTQTFYELSTPMLRRNLVRHNEVQQREVVERLVRRRGDRTALVSFSVKGLGDYDPCLSVTSRFRNDYQPVEMAGALRYDLSALLPSLYADLDSIRRDNILMTVPKTHIDTLEILKDGCAQVSLDATDWQFSDSLFEARITVVQTPSAVLFVRQVETRRCVVPVQKIGAIISDIRDLDRASKVRVAVKLAARKK
jgi:hypothetical protein